MVDAKQIGRFVNICRKEKGLTQKQLGEKLGVTEKAVSKWETGRSIPDISIIEPLCAEFDIQVSELLAGKRIAAKDYKTETEKLLMLSFNTKQLYRGQLCLDAMTLIAVFLTCLPFLMTDAGMFLPKINFLNISCWCAAAVLAVIVSYMNKKLPGRNIRLTSLKMELLWAVLYFAFMMGIAIFNIVRRGQAENVFAEEKGMLMWIVLIGLIGTVAVGSFTVRVRKWYYKDGKKS